ncbi:2-deoxy-D-gluconate 3-dehydrogenase [Micractinium conductrix]|uniref:2-deoxy-D-gluconate 3-dehydrogenase n=1 Tax=Micractinium conductrix TaxID=554055 RepID=A0A2P6V3P5_9CHLO|nr:2-deoxy-D-gluconate 3-dehydrogenase [Micractinium conductrix]|eukprot:PSC68695.1 2-deoxy-D-gluconate 3-dehydrogenase [Micractinium conductrix]
MLHVTVCARSAAARSAAGLLGSRLHARRLSARPWVRHDINANAAKPDGKGGLTEDCRSPATAGAAQRFRPEQLFDLSGSVAMITGAAQGIGAAVALGYARSGADLILADLHNEEKLAAVAEEVRALGRRVTTVTCDVRHRTQMDAAVKEAVAAMGQGPDILFCSAGIIGRLERAEHVSHDGWTEVLAVNVEGSYNAAHAAYPHMVSAGRGKVIFISSIAGTRSAGAQVAYACSKGAVLSLGRSLAAAWGKDNIQVNSLVPGAINTGFLDVMLANPRKLEYILGRIPLGRLGIAQDMVGPALFLASHASDYVTGAEIAVDGGGAVLPMLAAQNPDAYKA